MNRESMDDLDMVRVTKGAWYSIDEYLFCRLTQPKDGEMTFSLWLGENFEDAKKKRVCSGFANEDFARNLRRIADQIAPETWK